MAGLGYSTLVKNSMSKKKKIYKINDNMSTSDIKETTTLKPKHKQTMKYSWLPVHSVFEY